MKRLSPENAADRDYVKEYVADFVIALREKNATEAENLINEVSGTMWAMFGRTFPEFDYSA